MRRSTQEHDRLNKTNFVHHSRSVIPLISDYNVTFGTQPRTPVATDYMDMNKSFRPSPELLSVDSQKDYLVLYYI